MSTNAYLPCFKCAKVLPSAFEHSDNQPYGGTEFRTEGHYGSTFWDSFDGEELVLNICDDCLRAHTERLGQQKAYLPVSCETVAVGRLPVDRPLVAYTGNPDPAKLDVDIEDLGATGEGIEWCPDVAAIRDELKLELDQHD
jgi:hypothetical protein